MIIDEQSFWRRVTETSVWCETRLRQGDLRQSLRSPALGEEQRLGRIDTKKQGLLERKSEEDRRTIVDAVAARRAQILRDVSQDLDEPVQKLGRKFLVYLPDLDLSDGAAEECSQGYFDTCNAPPWDTWLVYIPAQGEEPGKLVSWVPANLVDLVDAAIQVNPEGCISWVAGEKLFNRDGR